MRRLGLLVALTAVLALPATASAQVADPVCQPSPDGSYQWQAAITQNFGPWSDRNGVHNPRGGAGGAAERALGTQFTGFGLDNGHYGWFVVYAPGTLDEPGARAAIRAEMATELTPDAIAFMDSKLHLVAAKYSAAELAAVQAQVPAIAAETGWNLGTGIGCTRSGEWGLEVTRYAVKQTPEVVAETEAKFARFGDKVSLQYCDCVIVPVAAPGPSLPPAPQPAQTSAPAPRPLTVADFYSKRCRDDVLTLRARSGAKSLRLTAGKRHVAGKRVRLKLKQRATRVKVTVTRDAGDKFSQWVTFKRC